MDLHGGIDTAHSISTIFVSCHFWEAGKYCWFCWDSEGCLRLGNSDLFLNMPTRMLCMKHMNPGLQRPRKDQARSSISVFPLWAGLRHPSAAAGWVDTGSANEISSKVCPWQSLLTTSLVVFPFSDLWVALGDMHGGWLRWKSIKNVTWAHKSQETEWRLKICGRISILSLTHSNSRQNCSFVHLISSSTGSGHWGQLKNSLSNCSGVFLW